MAVYAIGDIQGCYESLMALLGQVDFDRRHDQLWLAGDLVNRGPRSIDVLRWAIDLGDRATIVLGNHDLHLLAVAAGVRKSRAKDTFGDVLAAPDRDDLIDWLRRRPLMVVDGDVAMVHAGLIPSWSVAEARSLAAEVEEALCSDGWAEFLGSYQKSASPFEPRLAGLDRLTAIAAVLTHIRACTRDGTLHTFAGPPHACPDGYRPWYAHDGAAWRDHHILFGHWAARGFYEAASATCLDSGCVWGNRLTALRLDDRAVFQQRAIDEPG